ncbi:APC family permease [Propioniferax innocua]|uniref:Amino acid/polyamine/organocation transporter (APC superfamily) n=1 Tax=Propioniferax innocua TaxID=1753 RepID=A0A542ZQK2_9ACTN|nr:APC family permease [Propioniferax innocua]TQL62556.1 amino acid/polyamine/organocation transporter (APC superfamily) [Propioniferax innocua]
MQLARRLGTLDAVVIGLGAMIGAGVFTAFAPAAAAAGPALLVGLALAGIVAYCNATSSAQLAAKYPTSGGTYAYGRAELNDWWGFLAGWGFVIGKTASASAMSLTFAAYVLPDGGMWQRLLAVAGIWALTMVNYRGITKTAGLARILLAIVSVVLLAVIINNVLVPVESTLTISTEPPALFPDVSLYGVFQSAGLMFFAFAGYARIATLGEEVRDPTRTIPRAIGIALFIALALYAIIGVTLLWALGSEGIAATPTPLRAAAEAGPWASWLVPLVAIGGAVAALGALLALVAGIGRTSLAMAREGDLPGFLAAVHPRFQVPHRAEITLAVIVTIIVLLVDLRGVIGFSSFGVLLYYFVANLAAFKQTDQRRHPRFIQVLGMILCILLVATLPVWSIAAGITVFVVGALGRMIASRHRPAG